MTGKHMKQGKIEAAKEDANLDQEALIIWSSIKKRIPELLLKIGADMKLNVEIFWKYTRSVS